MIFLGHGILILVYLVLIIATCNLFTNAVEQLGDKLKLGHNAVGSILAVVGTTLPETIVPIVAIFGTLVLKNNNAGVAIAQGAVIGSPFMLSTLALFLMGTVVFLMISFKKRRKGDLKVTKRVILRYYKYFLFTYCLGILASFVQNYYFKILIVLILLLTYLIFIKRTLKKSKENYVENEIDELICLKFLKISNDKIFFAIIFQIVLALCFLVIFSDLFVREITYFSLILNVSPVILSLIITPFATELPECINSIIWIKANKDALAFANVLGAVVFQSVVPFSIGILFTPWIFDKTIILNILLVLFYSFLVVLFVLLKRKLNYKILLVSIIFYVLFIVFVLLK